MQKKKAVLSGISVALLVFAFGFSMMYQLWRRIGSPQGLPGLFYYRAATVGDAFCLPILVGSCAAFRQYNKTTQTEAGSRYVSLTMAVAAAVAAAAVQASWLIRDNTVLNWSIPIQHHFNLAGWYHSLFLS